MHSRLACAEGSGHPLRERFSAVPLPSSDPDRELHLKETVYKLSLIHISDNQGYTTTVHQTGQHIHTVCIGAEPVGFGGTCITIIYIGFLRLQHRPGFGIRFVGDGVGVFLTVCIGVYKFFGVAVDGICQLFFKVTACILYTSRCV